MEKRKTTKKRRKQLMKMREWERMNAVLILINGQRCRVGIAKHGYGYVFHHSWATSNGGIDQSPLFVLFLSLIPFTCSLCIHNGYCNEEKTVNEFYKWIGKLIGESERKREANGQWLVFLCICCTLSKERYKNRESKKRKQKTTQKRVYTKFSVHSVG